MNPEAHTMPPLNSEIYSNATFLFSYLQDVHILLHKPCMAKAAQLIFCPYSNLISPIVRRAMDIDIIGSIVILDEA